MDAQIFDANSSLPANINGAPVQPPVEWAVMPGFVARRLLSLPDVESVHVKPQEGFVQVWTIVDSPQELVFDTIYDMEKSIIEELKQFRFDFHVIAREGRSLPSIVTLSCQEWRRAA